MSYYFLYQKKGIPSWLAYSFILLMTVGISFGFRNNPTKIMSRADKNLIPKNITIGNLTNEAATIHFTTSDKTKAYLNVIGPDNQRIVKFDYQDNQQQQARQLHYFELNQLKANSQYSVEIFVENEQFIKTVQFKTLNYQYPTVSNPPLFGKVVKTDLTASSNTLVAIKIFPNDPYAYSTLTKSNGEWIITLPFVLDKNQQEVKLTKEQVLKIKFIDEDLKQSTVVVKYNDTKPLRSIVLGQDYDFTKSDLVLGVKKRQVNRLITAPTQNSIISSQYPAFRGQAFPNTLVKLVIEPNIANLLISTDDSGNWQYVPLKPLLVGQYQVYAKQGDKEATVKFNITKSGEAVLGEATPSAELTATPTQIPSEPTFTPVPSPTIQVIVPTNAFLTPTVSQTEIPRLGFNNNLLILMASGLSLLGLFLVLY